MNELALIGVSLIGLGGGIIVTIAAAVIAYRAGMGVLAISVVAVLGVIFTILLPSLIPVAMSRLIADGVLPVESMVALQAILGLAWPITLLILATMRWPALPARA